LPQTPFFSLALINLIAKGGIDVAATMGFLGLLSSPPPALEPNLQCIGVVQAGWFWWIPGG